MIQSLLSDERLRCPLSVHTPLTSTSLHMQGACLVSSSLQEVTKFNLQIHLSASYIVLIHAAHRTSIWDSICKNHPRPELISARNYLFASSLTMQVRNIGNITEYHYCLILSVWNCKTLWLIYKHAISCFKLPTSVCSMRRVCGISRLQKTLGLVLVLPKPCHLDLRSLAPPQAYPRSPAATTSTDLLRAGTSAKGPQLRTWVIKCHHWTSPNH